MVIHSNQISQRGIFTHDLACSCSEHRQTAIRQPSLAGVPTSESVRRARPAARPGDATGHVNAITVGVAIETRNPES